MPAPARKAHIYQLSSEAVAFYAKRPVAFVQGQLGGNPDKKQAYALEGLAEGDHVAMRSGHGVGKTATLAWAGLWFLSCLPLPRVIATAPTDNQLSNILWPEVYKWLTRGRHLEGDVIWQKEKIFLAGHEQAAFWVRRTSRQPDALQGFHADVDAGGNILLMMDEAPGIPERNYEAVEGMLTSPGARVMMAGNPTTISGTFFGAFHRDKAAWRTVHISAENHPRVTRAFCEGVARKWGLDSDVYRVRVLGEFPQGDPETLIPLGEAQAAIGRDLVAADKVAPIEIGADVARFGNDRTVIFGRRGMEIRRPKVAGKTSIPEVVRLVQQYAKELRQRWDFSGRIRVKVDDTGVGGGVTDYLRLEAKAHNLQIVPVNFGGAGNDDAYNYATVMWIGLRDTIEALSFPADWEDVEDLVAEISTRHYSVMPGGKIQIEPKPEYKNRLGFSPDLADALVLCLASPARGPRVFAI